MSRCISALTYYANCHKDRVFFFLNKTIFLDRMERSKSVKDDKQKKMLWAYSAELFNHFLWQGEVQSVLRCFYCKSIEGQLHENIILKKIISTKCNKAPLSLEIS